MQSFEALVRVNDGTVCRTTVAAESIIMAIKLLEAQYGSSNVLSTPTEA